jgi:predicted DNA-binding transcriptional regulator AlpA
MSSDPSTAATAELLTLRQAAGLCQVSERCLWGWATSGVSPAPVKIGRGTVRYRKREYLSWIANGCRPLNPEENGGENEKHGS